VVGAVGPQPQYGKAERVVAAEREIEYTLHKVHLVLLDRQLASRLAPAAHQDQVAPQLMAQMALLVALRYLDHSSQRSAVGAVAKDLMHQHDSGDREEVPQKPD
jgi:hypothetical protein